ncbi:hypothetical protein EXS53_01610 [Patescibacteria group bacterium]|nr:hypothetical protein [Patescibacteria group bacterium]
MEQQINPEHPKGNDSPQTMDADKAKKPKKGIKLFAIAIAVAVLSLAGYLGIKAYLDGNFAGNSLKNKKVFNQALASYNAFPGISNLSPTDQALLKSQVQAKYLAAFVVGLQPSDSTTATVRSLFGDNMVVADIARIIDSDIDQKLALAKTTGYYEGNLYYFWYDIVFNGGIEQKNKDYSLDQAKQYRDKLMGKKITPEEAFKQIRADKRLKLPDEVNGSGSFAGPINRPGQTDRDGRYESINAVLEAQTKIGFTDISNLVADTDYPKLGNKKEVGYFLIQITKVFKGQNDLATYDKQLELARSLVK